MFVLTKREVLTLIDLNLQISVIWGRNMSRVFKQHFATVSTVASCQEGSGFESPWGPGGFSVCNLHVLLVSAAVFSGFLSGDSINGPQLCM